MASLPVVPGVIQVGVGWTVGEDTVAETVLKFSGAGTPTSADLAAAATSMSAGIVESGIETVFGPHVSQTFVKVSSLATMDSSVGEAVGLLVGTRTGGPLSSGTCALINLAIEGRYRGGKPRSYMPWGTATDLTAGNLWNTGAIGDFQTAYGTMINAIISNPGPISGIVHCAVNRISGYTLGPAQPGGFRKKIGAPRIPPKVQPILSNIPSQHVGSQRRRNRA